MTQSRKTNNPRKLLKKFFYTGEVSGQDDYGIHGTVFAVNITGAKYQIRKYCHKNIELRSRGSSDDVLYRYRVSSCKENLPRYKKTRYTERHNIPRPQRRTSSKKKNTSVIKKIQNIFKL